MTSKSTEKKEIKLTGTLYYASVHKPQKAQEEGKKDMYNLSLVLEGKDLELAEELGLPVRIKEGIPGKFISTKSEYKPLVVDSQTNTIPETVLIGNGSRGIVSGVVYTYKPRKKDQTGVGLGLRGVQILDLVEYKKESAFKPTKGFTVSTTNSSQGPVDLEDDEASFN
jgi:hypothetical protein